MIDTNRSLTNFSVVVFFAFFFHSPKTYY